MGTYVYKYHKDFFLNWILREPHHYVKHELGELGKSALELSELRLFSKK